jgi:uncharacterized protein YneF (UPF0154 family)
MTEEFIVKELLDRIVALKKRLDRLFFLLITAIIFAIANLTGFNDIDIGGVIISDDIKYHLIMWVILSVLFGMIGAHLIDYVVKRSELDKLLENAPSVNRGNISKRLIPGSFFEFVYMLSVKSDGLKYLSVYGLLICLFLGHYMGILHLYFAFENNPVYALIFIGCSLLIYSLHYMVFIRSLTKGRKDLGKLILRHLLICFGVLILLSILPTVGFITN